ncbi:recombinase RecT [Candidatus Allofournierella excrementavium]|uniref:recombinase RecT n=1 Tax=Candidatus Allofournierella excrementavium TaxID=2838591 RepID=UPI003AB1C896
MALTTNTSGAIGKAATKTAVAKKDPSTGMRAYIAKMEGEIAKALPSVLTPERFTRITLSALSATPKLAETTPQSFLGAMMTAAQLGLEPNTPLGQAYLLPYKNKGVLECQFQLGYKGLIDLAYRSGQVSIIQAHAVHENDEFSYEYGLEPKLSHKPALRDRGEVTCYYAMFRTKDGGFGFSVMSKEDIQAHAERFSQSYGSDFSPWKTNFDEMAKKTVLKRVLKYAPLKSDFVKAAAADGTIKHDIAPDMADVAPVEADYVIDADTGEVTEVHPAEGGEPA